MFKNKTSVTNEITFVITENKYFPCKRNQSDCLKQQFPQKKKKKKRICGNNRRNDGLLISLQKYMENRAYFRIFDLLFQQA